MFKLTTSIFYHFTVRVRYAPSPTGMMHIGGLRTALFNQLFALKNQGKFIVRIQDTDQNRNVQGSLQNIFDTLQWLNINPDESIHNPNPKYQPYIQSQRLALYKNIQKMLLKNNLAYPCFCSHQRKTESNSQAKQKRKQKSTQNNQQNNQQGESNDIAGAPYDGRCSKLTMKQVKERILKGEPYAVRIKGNIFQYPPFFIDENYGAVNFVKFDDFIIVKKDGWPTFHFANVIDDWKMEVTHVIRGQQWLTNTSKHIYLYKVLGATVPKFLHLPLIQNQNGKKLAKRDPASSLVTLRKQYEPEAIKNFIFRLGWNPKQEANEKREIEMLSDSEMVEMFSTQGITKNPAKFDIKILNYLNKKALKKQWKQYEKLKKEQNLSKPDKQRLNQLKGLFVSKIKQHFSQASTWPEDKLIQIWQILHDRVTVNSDIKQYDFFFKTGILTYSSQKTLKDIRLLFGAETTIKEGQLNGYEEDKMKKNKAIMHNLRLILQHILPEEDFKQEKIASKISEFLYENKEVKNEDFYHLLRLIITEQKSGPSILKIEKLIIDWKFPLGSEKIMTKIKCRIPMNLIPYHYMDYDAFHYLSVIIFHSVDLLEYRRFIDEYIERYNTVKIKISDKNQREIKLLNKLKERLRDQSGELNQCFFVSLFIYRMTKDKDKKTMDLDKLVEHPSSLKLLILHTPFPLQISSLYKCTNLIKLDLSKNNLETFPFIGNLSNLKFMFIHQNKLDHKILRNIFFSEQSSLYSPLSRSIVWVTFWGNKNPFLARHFLCNSTNVLAVDNHIVSSQQRKASILTSQIQPFSPQTDVSNILLGKESLGKNTTEQEYMEHFWEEIRQLRKKIQKLSPIIKVQKVWRGWVVRKKLAKRQQQVVVKHGLMKQIFEKWKRSFLRKKKLFQMLQLKKKQHYLLPLKQMRQQEIKRKMLSWAARAKRNVLMKKMSLKKQVRFYNILRSNFLMFKSLYKQLQIDQSRYLMMDAQSFNSLKATIENFVNLFHNQPHLEIQQNKTFMIRQINDRHRKNQLSRILVINATSNVISINQKPNKKKNNPINLLNENICKIPTHSTAMKSLFKNEHKIHFNRKQQQKMRKCKNQLQKRQNLILEQFIIIKAEPRILKDIMRCIFYINTKALKIDDKIKLNNFEKVKLFSQKSLHKLASITLIQKFWRGYSFRKKQKNNAQICAKQYRAVVKIQRWIRNLPLRKRYSFMKQCVPILRSINDPFFFVKTDEYLKFIDSTDATQSNYLQKMKILEQSLIPYFSLSTKGITLFWNVDEIGTEKYRSNVKNCFSIKKRPLTQCMTNLIFKQNDSKRLSKDPFSLGQQDVEEYERGEVSHLFHFNTLTSLAQRESDYWMKITCNSVDQTKIRVFGILLKSFSLRDGIGIKIHASQTFDFQKSLKRKILNEECVFITKGDIDLQSKDQNVNQYQFKSKFYMKNDDDQKPIRLQENLLIFTHNFSKDNTPLKTLQGGQNLDSEINLEITRPKKRTRLSVEELYFSENTLDKGIIVEMQSRNFTLNNDQNAQKTQIKKTDLLPPGLKRILPLKKEIKCYKIEKRIKKRQPSFVLDNTTKQERVVTLPDLSVEEESQLEKYDQSQVQYSTVKQKIKKNYHYRREAIKSQKDDLSFHQNFINLNNFLQQQSISQQRRRIKTEMEINAYESADKIRSFHERSSDELFKKKQQRIRKVEQDMKNHKQTLQKHRLLKEQQKEDFHKMKSLERQKNLKNKQELKRLKVSFAEQCFPIISRAHNNRKNSSRMERQIDSKFLIP